MKILKMTADVHTGNKINEELIINNEKINNINAWADASVRPEHKGNAQKGITLLALIITIIVLLILSIVSVQLITKSGIIEKAKLATLKHEIAKYDEELKLYIVAHREEVNKNPINTSGYENMKKYIPSFKKKYENKLKIINNGLAFFEDNVTEEEKKLLENIGIRSDEMTQIYYLDENNKEQVLEINDATISETSYTSKNIAKEKITRVIIGSSCTKVQPGAFNGCESITSVTANTTNTVQVLADSPFGCKNLKNAYFSNVSIRDEQEGGWNGTIFNECTSLESITLGSVGHPVEELQARTFRNCTQKDFTIKIYVKDGVTSLGGPWGATNATIEYYSAVTGELVNVIWGTKYSGNKDINWTELPNADKITVIRANAFDGCENLALTSLPSNIKIIEKEAFKNCKKIAINQIPPTCKTISAGAFNGCESITSITANTTNTVQVLADSPFGCKNLKNAYFSNVSIRNEQEGGWNGTIFNECTSLESITLGSVGHPVEELQARTFRNCTQKDFTIKIYVKDGVTSLGGPWGATNATIEYYSAVTGELVNVIWGTKYSGNKDINWTELPNADKITVIRANAFDGCENLALTSLPSNIKIIEKEAFKNCKKIAINQIPPTCKTISAGAFNGCESITSITANTTNTVQVLADSPFGCKNLKNAYFSNVSIRNEQEGGWNGTIFNECTSLESITLGSVGHPVEELQARTFRNCTQKDFTIKIYVKDGVTSLGGPWGATNATIEYYSATTGEKIK